MVDGWDRLVLPKGHGEMVQAMVETHAQVPRSIHNRDSKVEMDLVRGKGITRRIEKKIPITSIVH